MKLTYKQKMFCDYYIASLNQTEAYQKAYGSTYDVARKNASRLMAKADIHTYIADIMMAKDNERIADHNEVLEKFTKQMRGEEHEEVVVSYKKGYEIVKKQISSRDQQKAAEYLAKCHGMFVDKINHSGDIGLHINVDYGDELEDS